MRNPYPDELRVTSYKDRLFDLMPKDGSWVSDSHFKRESVKARILIEHWTGVFLDEMEKEGRVERGQSPQGKRRWRRKP